MTEDTTCNSSVRRKQLFNKFTQGIEVIATYHFKNKIISKPSNISLVGCQEIHPAKIKTKISSGRKCFVIRISTTKLVKFFWESLIRYAF
jgi:hypothetical protein